MRDSAEVVTGPTRKMSMAQENKNEMEKELGEIRREVIESRNLVIKTDNLLKNLHAELKMVGKRQEDFQKRQWISSAAAYVMFAVFAIVAAITAVRASTASTRSEKEQLQARVETLTQEAEKARTESTANLQAQRAAGEVYRLMTQLPGDERLKGIDALGKLDTSRLSALEKQALRDRADVLRVELGQAAYDRGMTAFKRADYKDAISELSRFMTMNPKQEEAMEAVLSLGLSYNATGQHAEAVPLLTRYITEEKRSRKRDYAMLMLGQALQETNQLEKAADLMREAISTYPHSEYNSQMRGRLSTVKRLARGAEEAQAQQAQPVSAPAPVQIPSPTTVPPAAQ